MDLPTLEIQRRLLALGFDPGPLDGVRGRLTIRAIKAFQARHRLTADGIVGPATGAVLSHESRSLPLPPPSAPPRRESARSPGMRKRCG